LNKGVRLKERGIQWVGEPWAVAGGGKRAETEGWGDIEGGGGRGGEKKREKTQEWKNGTGPDKVKWEKRGREA